MTLTNSPTLASALFLWLTLSSSSCFGLSSSSPQQKASTRRQALSFGAGFFTTTILPHDDHQHDWAYAAGPVNPAEAVRRGAANIPGYGQTDVFYPQSFLGNWKAVREILPTNGNGSGASLTLEYPIRFLTSIEDNAVVADRGWNQANLEKAIRLLSASKDTNRNENNSAGDSLLPSYKWIETNPNDLRLTFADGSRKDIKVTKRATEKTDETVFSSEFSRVTQDDARGIPAITARRIISKWKVVGDAIEGIEVVYDVGAGDPMLGPTAASEQNKVLSKSRLRLQQVQ